MIRPPLWSSGQRFWLQIQRSGFDSLPYQTFVEIVGLERGPLSLLKAIMELLGRNISSGLENHCRRDPLCWQHDALTLTSPTSKGCSVGVVRSRTKTTELLLLTLYDKSLDSAFGKATTYRLDDWGTSVPVTVGSWSLTFLYRPEGGKVAGAWSWSLSSNLCRGQENVATYHYHFHRVNLQFAGQLNNNNINNNNDNN
jgi:hypothetical protein